MNLDTHVSMHPIYIELFKYAHMFVCMIFASTCKFSDASAFGVFKIEIGIAIDAFKYYIHKSNYAYNIVNILC